MCHVVVTTENGLTPCVHTQVAVAYENMEMKESANDSSDSSSAALLASLKMQRLMRQVSAIRAGARADGDYVCV